MYTSVHNRMTDAVVAPGRRVRELIWNRDLPVLAVSTVIFALCIAYLAKEIDAVGPVFGASATLVALALPAAGLVGPVMDSEREYLEQQWKDHKMQPKDIQAQLELQIQQARNISRGLIWLYLSLPVAAVALLRPSLHIVSGPDVWPGPSWPVRLDHLNLDLWQLLTAVGLALFMVAVGRLIPPTTRILGTARTEAVRRALASPAPNGTAPETPTANPDSTTIAGARTDD